MSSELDKPSEGIYVAVGDFDNAQLADKSLLKDSKAGFIYADLLWALLTSGPEPINGWTMHKLHKAAYRRYSMMVGNDIPEEGQFVRFWNKMTSRFSDGDREIDPELLALFKQIKSHIEAHPRTLDVLNPNKELLWHCESWMFPKRTHDHFLPKSSGGSPEMRSMPADKSFIGAPLIVANSPLPEHVGELWSKSGKKFCADGGANRIYEWHLTYNHDPASPHFFPDFLVGDLDSVKSEIRVMFCENGTEIVYNSDENNTDLEKTLDVLDSLNFDMNYLVITGCSGGNIGQEFANYHACWKHAHRQIALVSENGIALFLVPGKHRIQSAVGMKCSLLPLGEPCASVTTTGLKWNLDNAEMQFGGLISSSNLTESEEVTIENSHPLVWTFDFAP